MSFAEGVRVHDACTDRVTWNDECCSQERNDCDE